MANGVDRVGETYGRLTVVSRAGTSPHGQITWLCKCVCGNTRVVLAQSLSRGSTTSCGCLQRERAAASNEARVLHGHARQGPNNSRLTSPEYRSWKAMLERCRNPNAPNYHLYGGRGISVCDQWLGRDGFPTFLKDMGERKSGYTIDRIDSDGNYQPDNCRWATAKAQAQNRRETPEYAASRKASLDAGRERMWADPEIRARLVDDRQHRRRESQQPKGP